MWKVPLPQLMCRIVQSYWGEGCPGGQGGLSPPPPRSSAKVNQLGRDGSSAGRFSSFVSVDILRRHVE